MFNSIRGRITFKSDETIHLLSEGGIEWEIAVSGRSLRVLPDSGGEARVLVFLYHREDIMKLFGFIDEDERSLFFDLMKVQGIGPRQAMKILSGMDVKAFISHLEAGDADSLTRIQGLGKKTAQKIILTLKGKLQLDETDGKHDYEDIVTALSEMGYDKKDCLKVVQKIMKDSDFLAIPGPEREKELFRKAIIALSS